MSTQHRAQPLLQCWLCSASLGRSFVPKFGCLVAGTGAEQALLLQRVLSGCWQGSARAVQGCPGVHAHSSCSCVSPGAAPFQLSQVHSLAMEQLWSKPLRQKVQRRTEMLPWHLPWQCQGLDQLGSLDSPCPCQNPFLRCCSQAGVAVLMNIPKLCSVPSEKSLVGL